MASSLIRNVKNFHKQILIGFALILLPLIYFYPVVIGDVILAPGDGWSSNLGPRVLLGEMIRNWQLPLWNQYIFAGMPFLASIQPGVLYPLNWLFAVFSPQVAMNVMMLASYMIAILGTYLYTRRIGINQTGAIAASIVFSFSGFMIGHLGHSNMVAAAAWLPWIILTIEELCLQVRWRWIAFGAIFIALQFFAGHPQISCYTLFTAGSYGIFSFYKRTKVENKKIFFLAIASMGICGLLISLAQLLPTREMLKLTQRNKIGYGTFSEYSLPPDQILGLIFPYFHGGGGSPLYKVPYWGAWNLTETEAFIGITSLLCTIVAIGHYKFCKQRNFVFSFWVICGSIAFILALGSYLPFDAYKVLYNIPIYKLFRASARNLLEFTFAIAILSGFGITWTSQLPKEKLKRVLIPAFSVITFIIALSGLIYLYLARYFALKVPYPQNAGSIYNPEFYIPILFFIASIIAFYAYSYKPSVATGFVLCSVILAEMASFGHFYEWRYVTKENYDINRRLADSPTVKFIKEQEPEWNSFRIVSQSYDMHGPNADTLDTTNIAVIRKLQTVNGYDPLHFVRTSNLAGDMEMGGRIPDNNVFLSHHQGLNLLNVKYLLYDHTTNPESHTETIDGVKFLTNSLKLFLSTKQGGSLKAKAEADELVIISSLYNGASIQNNSPVLKISFYKTDGTKIERELLAGRDTSDEKYDDNILRPTIQHDKAKVIENFPESGYIRHNYIARINFDRTFVDRIDIEYIPKDGFISISCASLYDKKIKQAIPLTEFQLPSDRWTEVKRISNVSIYKNTKALPRVWFVPKAYLVSNDESLKIIKSGKLPDGQSFDPLQVVLLDKNEKYSSKIPHIGDTTDAEAKITNYSSNNIDIETRNRNAGFLVLSEIYYEGWEATIDGKGVPIERVNYALRSIRVPSGNHKIDFSYKPLSFRLGLFGSLLGIAFLIGGGVLGPQRIRGGALQFCTFAGRLLPSRLFESFRQISKKNIIISEKAKGSLLIVFAVCGLSWYGKTLVANMVDAVGGADTSGYINLATSIPQGRLMKPITELNEFGLSEDYNHYFVPLGFYGVTNFKMSPIYPIGLPIQMAVSSIIIGWKYGPFIISPLSALLSIVFIFFIARELGLSRFYSLLSSITLAFSPPFVYMGLQPMSDVPATCWSLLSIFATLRSRKTTWWAVIAGAAFGMVFLIRPTSLLLIPAIAICLRYQFKTILYFIIGGVPLAIIFLITNYLAFDSLLGSGYLATGHDSNFKILYFPDRFRHYIYWINSLMSPIILIGWVCVLFIKRIELRIRILLFVWFISFFLFYCFYSYYDAWWYLRFLLPSIPALILGAMITLGEISRKISSNSQRWISPLLALVVLYTVLIPEFRYIKRFYVLNIKQVERGYSNSISWAEKYIPQNSLVICMQMSGAIRYYTSLSIGRWDQINNETWQIVQQKAKEKGKPIYALLMPFEIEQAKKNIPAKFIEIGKDNDRTLYKLE